MAEKCFKCGEKIEVTFLGKILGTYIKGNPVCYKCQKLQNKEAKNSTN